MLRNVMFTFFMLSIMLPNSSIAQEGESKYPVPYDEKKGKIIYAKVVNVKGTDKTTLFERFNDWGNKFYPYYSQKVEKRKKNAKVPFIEIKAGEDLKVDGEDTKRYKYELKVQFKDERYRYEFHKLHMDKGFYYGLERWIDPKNISKQAANKNLQALDKKMNEIISNMNDYMTAPPEKKEESQW